jgi:hypothetical protein
MFQLLVDKSNEAYTEQQGVDCTMFEGTVEEV